MFCYVAWREATIPMQVDFVAQTGFSLFLLRFLEIFLFSSDLPEIDFFCSGFRCNGYYKLLDML